MDVTNIFTQSLTGKKEITTSHNELNRDIIKQNQLKRVLTKMKLALFNESRKKAPSFDTNSKIALAESYLKSGDIYQAEKIIRETSNALSDNSLSNTFANRKISELEKKEDTFDDVKELKKNISNIKHALNKANPDSSISIEVSTKVALAEAYLRNDKIQAADEMVKEASNIIFGKETSLRNYTYTREQITLKNSNLTNEQEVELLKVETEEVKPADQFTQYTFDKALSAFDDIEHSFLV